MLLIVYLCAIEPQNQTCSHPVAAICWSWVSSASALLCGAPKPETTPLSASAKLNYLRRTIVNRSTFTINTSLNSEKKTDWNDWDVQAGCCCIRPDLVIFFVVRYLLVLGYSRVGASACVCVVVRFGVDYCCVHSLCIRYTHSIITALSCQRRREKKKQANARKLNSSWIHYDTAHITTVRPSFRSAIILLLISGYPRLLLVYYTSVNVFYGRPGEVSEQVSKYYTVYYGAL